MMEDIDKIVEALELFLIAPGASKEEAEIVFNALMSALRIRQTNRLDVTKLVNKVLSNYRKEVFDLVIKHDGNDNLVNAINEWKFRE
jgi:hypothetical protein